jgi:hypothetical protein
MAKLSPKQAAMADEIKAVLEKYGFKQTSYLISQGGATSRLTINVTNPAADGSIQSPYSALYKNDYLYHGFKLEWLDTKFSYGGPVTFKGFHRKGKRGMIQAVLEKDGGKLVVAPIEVVKDILARRASTGTLNVA